jgi:hypothetical protein
VRAGRPRSPVSKDRLRRIPSESGWINPAQLQRRSRHDKSWSDVALRAATSWRVATQFRRIRHATVRSPDDVLAWLLLSHEARKFNDAHGGLFVRRWHNVVTRNAWMSVGITLPHFRAAESPGSMWDVRVATIATIRVSIGLDVELSDTMVSGRLRAHHQSMRSSTTHRHQIGFRAPRRSTSISRIARYP